MQPAPGLNAIVLTGRPVDLNLPWLCARCGRPATSRLRWERVFQLSDSEDGHRYEIVAAEAPFCSDCTAEHERAVRRFTPLERALMCFRSQYIVPATVIGLFTLWTIRNFLPALFETPWSYANYIGLLPPIFGLMALLCLRAAWHDSHRHAVPPLTSVTDAFAFSPDIAGAFEGERHRYAISNEAFYHAFVEANHHLRWRPSGAAARKARGKRYALYAAIAVVVVVAAVWDWVAPYLR
ncbi:MAG: hypothetical protein R2729_08065 [Bryobacteraceae bacterium]